LVKESPSVASLAILGVLISPPKGEMSVKPRSSARINTTLRRSDSSAAIKAVEESVATTLRREMPKDRENIFTLE